MTDKDGNMNMRNDGLYVSLLPDGTIKKHLITDCEEVPLEDTTIAEELIRLSEQDHIDLYKAIKEMWAIAGMIEEGNYSDSIFTIEMELFLHKLRREHLVRYALLMTQFGEKPNDRPFYIPTAKESALSIVENFSQAMSADVTVGRVLSALSSNQPIDLEGEHFMLRKTKAIAYFTFDGSISTEYQFRTEDHYYIFLLQNFLCSEPRVACCQYCGRYFIPKSRRKTLYCDRVIRDGKTCKQVAPHLNRKERAAADKVVSEFNRVKDMLVHRLERAQYDKKSSPIDLTREEYYRWLDAATAARERYLSGELSEEEAWKIIHVPTIQEQQSGLVTAT